MKRLFFTLSLSCLVFSAILAKSADIEDKKQQSDSLVYNTEKDTIQPVDLVDYIVRILKIKGSKERRDDRKVRFSLFPSSSTAAGDKTVFTSFNVAFVTGNLSSTNVSTIYFYPYIGFGGQYGFQVQPSIWLSRNSWNFIGEYFILNYPQNTWGLGGNSKDENMTMVDYDRFRIHQNAMKSIFQNFSAGLGYAYDKHFNIKVEESGYSSTIEGYMPQDKDYTVSSGLTLPVLYDRRKNLLNPQRGFMASMTYSFYHPALGSDDKWQSVFIDMRKYFSLSTQRYKYKILALRSYYWTIVSGNPPYFDLPANRWEPVPGSASRGIKQNRYRSNAILYFESEYRFGITANGLLGGVVFASLTSPSEYNTQQFKYWHPAAGTGVRLKFNKYSNTNITFDLGFSREFATVYINIGEAF